MKLADKKDIDKLALKRLLKLTNIKMLPLVTGGSILHFSYIYGMLHICE